MKVEKENKELSLEEQIIQWKKTYKKIYATHIDNTEYIWHRITRKDYSAVMEINKGETMEDKVYNRQVAIIKLSVLNMSEEDLNEKLTELAGLSSSLADEILNKSGFSIESTVEL